MSKFHSTQVMKGAGAYGKLKEQLEEMRKKKIEEAKTQ
jgi:hypothetical protein